MLWIVALVHRFCIGMRVAPVGAGFEEVVVEGVADLEERIGVNPVAAHDFIEILAGAADLLRQPCDAPPLPCKLRFYKPSDVKGLNGGVFVFVHIAVCLERSPSSTSNKKGGESFLVCAYLPLRYRQTPVTLISTE